MKMDSSITCKWFERNPDFDWSDGCAGLRNAGKPLKLWRVPLSTSGRGQPASQQPDPGIAKQGGIVYSNDRVLSRLEHQTLTTHPPFRALLSNAGEVMDLAIAGAGRRAIEL